MMLDTDHRIFSNEPRLTLFEASLIEKDWLTKHTVERSPNFWENFLAYSLIVQ